mmetsp:Transcript_2447/g.5140  ORF Transcript_2447/g.5140 Transcript_2447/m.5140 type:complete len:98 (+) Transcript_2447:9-302(+)
MYYAPAPQRNLQIVKPGETAGVGQFHAVLDAAANVDADSVTASNSTYEYAGIDASHPSSSTPRRSHVHASGAAMTLPSRSAITAATLLLSQGDGSSK